MPGNYINWDIVSTQLGTSYQGLVWKKVKKALYIKQVPPGCRMNRYERWEMRVVSSVAKDDLVNDMLWFSSATTQAPSSHNPSHKTTSYHYTLSQAFTAPSTCEPPPEVQRQTPHFRRSPVLLVTPQDPGLVTPIMIFMLLPWRWLQCGSANTFSCYTCTMNAIPK